MKFTSLIAVLVGFSCLLGVNKQAAGQSTEQWTLPECIDYALEHNIDVRQQKLETELSAAQLKSSKADLLPSVNGSSNFNYTTGRSVDPFTNEISNTNRTSSDMGLSAQLTLFRGMQRKNAIERDAFSLKADRENLELIKDNISLEVTRAYMQILFNRELLQAAEDQLEVTRQQSNRTEKLVEAGKLAKSDFLEIEAQQAQERLQMVERRNMVKSAILDLTQLLELDSVGDFAIAAPDITIKKEMHVLPDIHTVYQEARNALPHVKMAEYQVQASKKQHEVAKGSFYPTLAFRANYYTGYSSTRNLYDSIGITTPPIGYVKDTEQLVFAREMQFKTQNYPFIEQLQDNAQTALSLQLNIPIFQNLNNKTQVINSKIRKLQSENNLEQRENQLRKEIQNAHSDALAALEKFMATEKNVEANKEAFQYAKQRFNLGLINSVDYNSAKNNLNSAQSELLKAKYDFIFKRTILDFYRGRELTIK